MRLALQDHEENRALTTAASGVARRELEVIYEALAA